MRPIILLSLFQVVSGEVFRVSGYVGDNITLPSGVNPSWTLYKVDWSIFSNNTWIATLESVAINTERRAEYRGRLSLDKTSGNLTIYNLRKSDEMEYTVDLLSNDNENEAHSIKLIVKQKLQKPNITIIATAATNTRVFFLLRCSSPDDSVHFSWEVQSLIFHQWNNSDPSQLVVFFNTSVKSVNVTCTSSRQMEKKSVLLTLDAPVSEGVSVKRHHWVLLLPIFVIIFGTVKIMLTK